MATADDKLELSELLYDYAYSIDVGTTEADFLGLFTDDAILFSPISGGYEGREGLRKFYRMAEEHRVSARVRHVITNCVVKVEGDTAAVRAYLVETSTVRPELGSQPGQTKLEVTFAGEYEIEARRSNGSWKMHRRRVYLDNYSSGS